MKLILMSLMLFASHAPAQTEPLPAPAVFAESGAYVWTVPRPRARGPRVDAVIERFLNSVARPEVAGAATHVIDLSGITGCFRRRLIRRLTFALNGRPEWRGTKVVTTGARVAVTFQDPETVRRELARGGPASVDQVCNRWLR